MSNFKLTAKQERFVLLVVKGEAQSRAYEQAGYKCKNAAIAATSASTLMKNPKVQGRIAEIQSQLAKKTVISLESLTDDLLETRRDALKAGSYGPAVAASVAVARLHGFMVERQELTIMNRPAPLPTKILELSEDEWLEQFGSASKPLLLNAAKLINKK